MFGLFYFLRVFLPIFLFSALFIFGSFLFGALLTVFIFWAIFFRSGLFFAVFLGAGFFFLVMTFLGLAKGFFLVLCTFTSGMVTIFVFTKPRRISLTISFFTAWRFNCVCLTISGIVNCPSGFIKKSFKSRTFAVDSNSLSRICSKF